MKKYIITIMLIFILLIFNFWICYPFIYLLGKYNINIFFIFIFSIIFSYFSTKLFLKKLRNFMYYHVIKHSYSQILISYYNLCILHRKRYQLYFSEFSDDKENIEECSKAIEKALKMLIIECNKNIFILNEQKRAEKNLIDKFRVLEEKCYLLLNNESCTDYLIK